VKVPKEQIFIPMGPDLSKKHAIINIFECQQRKPSARGQKGRTCSPLPQRASQKQKGRKKSKREQSRYRRGRSKRFRAQ